MNIFTKAYDSVKSGLSSAYSYTAATAASASKRLQTGYQNAKLFTEMDFQDKQESVEKNLNESINTVKETVSKTSQKAIETLNEVKEFFKTLNPMNWIKSFFELIAFIVGSIYSGICSLLGIKQDDNSHNQHNQEVELTPVDKTQPSTKEQSSDTASVSSTRERSSSIESNQDGVADDEMMITTATRAGPSTPTLTVKALSEHNATISSSPSLSSNSSESGSTDKFVPTQIKSTTNYTDRNGHMQSPIPADRGPWFSDDSSDAKGHMGDALNSLIDSATKSVYNWFSPTKPDSEQSYLKSSQLPTGHEEQGYQRPTDSIIESGYEKENTKPNIDSISI
ncbi:MAG TPA: hypothetical protein QF353_01365 [Gammaproteobacteria bacterium]|nr:hypothetical protein [Gammaproteobacteria bacterium]